MKADLSYFSSTPGVDKIGQHHSLELALAIHKSVVGYVSQRKAGNHQMQEKIVEQVNLFIRDQITGRHMFNPEALRVLGIDPEEAQSRGFEITRTASVPEPEMRQHAAASQP